MGSLGRSGETASVSGVAISATRQARDFIREGVVRVRRGTTDRQLFDLERLTQCGIEIDGSAKFLERSKPVWKDETIQGFAGEETIIDHPLGAGWNAR